MTTIETRRYEMLVRVRDFGEAQLDLFPASSVARDQFGAVGAAVRALSTHAVDKMSATREGRNTGVEDKFQLPDSIIDQGLLTAGRVHCSFVMHRHSRVTSSRMYARQINIAEARAFGQLHAYQPLNLLRVPQAAPTGFTAQVAVDANGYIFSIKDTSDPCGFAYFSDQEGVIFTGEFIR
jgi:hypothetical protein